MPKPPKHVLTLNCGSSSIKFALIDPRSGETPFDGMVEKIGTPGVCLHWQHGKKSQDKSLDAPDYPTAIQAVFKLIHDTSGLAALLLGIGHRVAHGGEHFTQSTLIDDPLLATIKDCAALAPLHNPANILGIEAAREAFPALPQVAVFDTAFHQTLPDYAYLYAIPYTLYKQHGIRRYGFHGTSHRYVTTQAAKYLDLPLDQSAFLSAHLGNGCSATAVLNGKSIDTSMGMTPLEGLVMGTRSGDVDPGLHDYLAKKLNTSVASITRMLNKESGLLGLSECSMDMRTLVEAAQKGNTQATLAIEVFCYKLAKYLAALTVPLGRIDALIFTGGIGEHVPLVRGKVIDWLAPFGFSLDKRRNAAHGAKHNGIITKDNSTKALVVATNEALLIAQDVLDLV